MNDWSRRHRQVFALIDGSRTIEQIATMLQQPPWVVEKFLGCIRATLNIDNIWTIVASDSGANGKGSYALMLDQNGVRIADAVSLQLFTAIAPLPLKTQQMITNEARYGSSSQVPVLPDRTLAGIQQSTHAATTFQTTPAGQSELFQVTQRTMTVVPWTYVVLSPLSTVTAVADQQLIITSLVVFLVLVGAALIGLMVGQRITRPILRAVDSLQGNSHVLTSMAAKQKSVASEQKWVIDSSTCSCCESWASLFLALETTPFLF